MDHQIGLFIVGILSLLGGIELVRFSWADSGEEQQDNLGNPYGRSVGDAQPATLGVTLGAVMVLFAFVAFYGGYSGWTIMKVLSTVGDLAQQFLV
jgi:hypothetical protein